mgnify:CR=1 FL=1
MKKIIMILCFLTISFLVVGCKEPEVDNKIDQAKIDNVIQLINELPLSVKIDASCQEQIEAARAAYDALTDLEKESLLKLFLTSGELRWHRTEVLD